MLRAFALSFRESGWPTFHDADAFCDLDHTVCGRYAPGMTEHHTPEPPAQYSYAVGAGLGLLIGGGVGLFLDEDKFLPLAVIGLAIGLVVAYLVRTIRS